MATKTQRIPSSNNMSNNSTNVVGVHYKVGRKLGEGSFGIIYEGKSFLAAFHEDYSQ